MTSTIQWLLLLLGQESRCQWVFDICEYLTSNFLFNQKKKKKKNQWSQLKPVWIQLIFAETENTVTKSFFNVWIVPWDL